MVDLSKYKELFLSGVREKLDEMANLSVSLEKAPKDKEVIDEIFRNAHSIKGMSATMGYGTMSELSHKLENLFDKLRKGDLTADEKVVDTVLKAHSIFTEMLTGIEKKNTDDYPIENMIGQINDVIEGKEIEKSKDEKVVNNGLPSVVINDPFVRVKAVYLDRIIDVISQFIALKWRLKNKSLKEEDLVLEQEVENMERLIREMSEKVLSMRMLPLSLLTSKLHRLVREMSKDLSKSCELEISGESIELDKNVIESLEGPILHIIRNCIDHGIEEPKKRSKAGKGPSGNIFFKAYRFQNRVVIEIGDDGRGIDLEKIQRLALDKNIISQMDLDLMNAERKYLLICTPGLSTLSKVSEVSGRGVGMDVVKSNIESLGGSLSIFSGKGMGSTFQLNLPLTTAIIKVFVVGADGVQYGMPSFPIEKVDEFDSSRIIPESEGNYYMYGEKENEEKISLLKLGKILNPEASDNINGIFKALVIKNSDKRVLMAVDEFYGMEEVIVRPLSVILKNFKGVSGVTVLPTGSPMFILSPDELI